MRNHIIYTAVILLQAVSGDQLEAEETPKREGRQFFVTTTTATTTLSTIKFCWVQTATATGVYRCKRDARLMKYTDQHSITNTQPLFCFSVLLTRRLSTFLII